MAGKLIVFEGGDGCGKTTQLQHLARWLGGQRSRLDPPPREIVITKEPGATVLGQTLRQLLLNPAEQEPLEPTAELLLYAADRAQHVQRQLKPQLEAGAWVLCDRYADSTLAYQGYGRGLDLGLIDQLNQIATAGLESDLTLWLDLDPQRARERLRDRGGVDRMEQTDLAFHQRIRQGFAQLAQRYPQRIVQVDGAGELAIVAQRIQAVIQAQPWFKP